MPTNTPTSSDDELRLINEMQALGFQAVQAVYGYSFAKKVAENPPHLTNGKSYWQLSPNQAKELLSLIKQDREARDVSHEKEIMTLIDERDSLEKRLESMSGAVAAYFGEEIGEHSNINDPWYNAFELLRYNTRSDTPPTSEAQDE